MSTNFRSEVFKLCKKLQKNDVAKKIGGIIHDMSTVSESKEIGEKITDPRNDFAYIAKHNNTEFHGFVFLDDNIGNIKQGSPLNEDAYSRVCFSTAMRALLPENASPSLVIDLIPNACISVLYERSLIC